MDEATGQLKAEVFREFLLQRFNTARITETMTLNGGGRGGPGFDFTWKNDAGLTMQSRIAYLPSLQPQPSLGHVTVVLDVSGSISADAIAEARGHILDLLAATPPTRLDLLTADVRLVQLDRDIDRDKTNCGTLAVVIVPSAR